MGKELWKVGTKIFDMERGHIVDIANILIPPNITIRKTLEIIDKSSKQIALIVDDNKKLLGTINDGDIRRAILNGHSLDDSIENVYFKNPTVASMGDAKESIIKLAALKKIHQIPLVNKDGLVIDLAILDELLEERSKTNRVVLMVGGLGTRLRPLTDSTPKPMLMVGNKPMLQTIVEKFVEYGYVNISMCVNYKSNVIQDYFGDGSAFGAHIDYVTEEQRMGTAGALSLLREKPSEPFFVMNGDLLTNVNFEHLHDFHFASEAMGTMCVREYDFQVPYGVVNIENNKILSIEEKPIHRFFVSAGIYMLSPKALDYVPNGEFYDMPTLFESLIKDNMNVASFPIREYWLDIGRMEEYERANIEYRKVF